MASYTSVMVRGPKFGTVSSFQMFSNDKIRQLKQHIQIKSNYTNIKLCILGQKTFFGDNQEIQNCMKPDEVFLATGDPPPDVTQTSAASIWYGRRRAAVSSKEPCNLFADLQIIARDRDDESKEHVILAHRFILDAFAPSFLQKLLSSPLAIEGDKDNNNSNNNEIKKNANNNNDNKENKPHPIHKVYYNEFRANVVNLFLEFVYTLSIESFGRTSHEEMIEYKSMQSLYISEYKSMEDRAFVLASQINSPAYADVAFLCDGAKIYAHKALLSLVCDVFRAMFDPSIGLIESRQAEVSLPEVPADAFLNVLRYIYIADLEIDSPVTVEVLMLADQYCLRNLKYAAQVEMRNALSIANACDFASLAHQTNSTYLLAACVHFIASNLNEVVHSEGFQTLDSSVIEKIAARIVSRIVTNYDPAIFITEILSTIQQLKGTLAVDQCSRLLTDLCTRIGKSREQDEYYTSNVRSDLLKDKFQQLKVPFEEIKHESYLASKKWLKPKPSTVSANLNVVTVTVSSLLASQLAVDVPLVMKNLVFWWKDNITMVRHYVTVLTCGDKRIDESKLGNHLKLDKNSHLSLANASSVFKVIGASAAKRRVPPFGFRKNIKTIIERNVFTLAHIYVPSGREETTWKMSPSSLITMLDKLGIERETAELLGTEAMTSSKSNYNNNKPVPPSADKKDDKNKNKN